MKNQILYQHITDPAYTPENLEKVTSCEFIATGASYGRIIFNHRPPLMYIPAGQRNVIANCKFSSLPDGTAIMMEGSMVRADSPLLELVRAATEAVGRFTFGLHDFEDRT